MFQWVFYFWRGHFLSDLRAGRVSCSGHFEVKIDLMIFFTCAKTSMLCLCCSFARVKRFSQPSTSRSHATLACLKFLLDTDDRECHVLSGPVQTSFHVVGHMLIEQDSTSRCRESIGTWGSTYVNLSRNHVSKQPMLSRMHFLVIHFFGAADGRLPWLREAATGLDWCGAPVAEGMPCQRGPSQHACCATGREHSDEFRAESK